MQKDKGHQLLTGSFKPLLRLFVPVMLMTFSNCIFLFLEKLFLARLSVEAMVAAVSATYACMVFQVPCVALAMMAQVFVARWLGGQEFRVIGPGIWQFIWFSFLSMVITVPGNLIYGHYYFQGVSIEAVVQPYFIFLVSINFLYPLAAVLTCFYLGQGKTLLVLYSTVGSQVLKMLLAYLLIFGWGDWIPAFGLMGGAISTLIAQGGVCLLLFLIFISKKNVAGFDSRNWFFRPRLFWDCIQTGLLRAGNRILNVTSWASIAYLMSSKGGEYQLVLSLGGTLFLFLPFLGDALCQAQTIVVSQILGAERYDSLKKAFRSGSLLSLAAIAIMAIPFLCLPLQTYNYLFSTVVLSETVVRLVFFGIWLSFAFSTFGFVPISYILAFKDTKFSLFMGCLNWLNGYLLMFFAINYINIPSDQFWIVLSLMHGSTALMYVWRMKWLESKIVPKFALQTPLDLKTAVQGTTQG